MTETPISNGNGGVKSFNRRFKTGCLALGLITVSYYLCLFKNVEINWFLEYAKIVSFITGAVILGLTLTDGIGAFRKNT